MNSDSDRNNHNFYDTNEIMGVRIIDKTESELSLVLFEIADGCQLLCGYDKRMIYHFGIIHIYHEDIILVVRGFRIKSSYSYYIMKLYVCKQKKEWKTIDGKIKK